MQDELIILTLIESECQDILIGQVMKMNKKATIFDLLSNRFNFIVV